MCSLTGGILQDIELLRKKGVKVNVLVLREAPSTTSCEWRDPSIHMQTNIPGQTKFSLVERGQKWSVLYRTLLGATGRQLQHVAHNFWLISTRKFRQGWTCPVSSFHTISVGKTYEMQAMIVPKGCSQ